MRDLAFLEMGSALASNLAADTNAGPAEIATVYAFGISKAHACVDGNKRTAFVTALTFMRLDGYSLRSDTIEGVRMMENLAAGEVIETDFAKWLSADMKRI